MSEAQPPERINLRQADDSRDVIHRAVAALAQGARVLLMSERFNGYLVPLWLECGEPQAVVEQEVGSCTLLVRGVADLADWVPSLSAFSARIARRAWPSPLVLVFPLVESQTLFHQLPLSAQAMLKREGGVATQCSEHPFVREVLRLLPGPTGFQSVDTDEVHLDAGDSALVVVDYQEPFHPKLSTIVKMADDHWTVVREGLVSEAMLTRISGTIILFVCTGNTCRSPLAEALCKILLAKRLGCEIDALEKRGYVVLSAGIAASPGMPAASNAIQVVETRGGTLRSHASRPITRDMIDLADHIIVMTFDHLEALTDRVPEAAQRARLLHPEGKDVPDPVGLDINVYQRTASAIESYLNPWLDSIGL